MGRILIVDDDAGTRLTLARALRDAGHAVDVAENGRDGVNLQRNQPFELIILDLYMPEQDGVETLIELHREFPEIAVVAISGHRQMDLMLRAAKGLGAIRTLAKPFEPETLLAVVAKELNRLQAGK